MGRDTSIGWCHHTFNGVHGCAHAILSDSTESPGCLNCYAEAGSKRNPKMLGIWGEEGTRVLAADSAWEQLGVWHRAAVRDGEMRRVFCYSIGDVFESPRSLANADICAKGRTRLFATIERLQPVNHRPFSTDAKKAGLVFLLLTKRPENVLRKVPASWLVSTSSSVGWPQHVWLGTSVENQQTADERIPHLLHVPGVPVRFLSMEPLLERVDVRWALNGERMHSCGRGGVAHNDSDMCCACHMGSPAEAVVKWIITGGESGSRARPCDLAWIRDLRDQARAAGVPFWNKQLGARAIDELRDGGAPPYRMLRLPLIHAKGGDPSEWPADLRVQEAPHA